MWRFPDDLADDHRLEGLVQAALNTGDFPGEPYDLVRARLLAGYSDACCKAAKSTKDTFVMRATLLRYMPPPVLAALARRLSDTEPGMLHLAGDVCPCLEGRPWPPYVEFAVHDFLKSNPTRAERQLRDQKRRELRQYRAEVLRRDRFLCRHCLTMPDKLDDHRSPRALQIDHVDPNGADGPVNLVTLCKECNTTKTNQTPDQKHMRLYAAPATPAVDFADAVSTVDATRAELHAAPRPVMPGHGLPVSSMPSPRPPSEANPFDRGQIPRQPAPGPDRDPPGTDPPRPGTDPGPDPDPTRSRSGYDRDPQPEPHPDVDPGPAPDPKPDRDPAPGYPGREGTQHLVDEHEGLSGNQSRVLLALTDTAQPAHRIADQARLSLPQTEAALRYLAGAGRCDRLASTPGGVPVRWRRRDDRPP